MTENEALEILKISPQMRKHLPNLAEVYDIAIKVFEEVEQYRAIGTVEEFKSLKEKLDMKNRCKDCAGCIAWKCDCSNIRAKAIDEFKKAMLKRLHDCIDTMRLLDGDDIREVAEQMKGSEVE